MTTPLLHGVCAAMTSPFDDTGEHLDEGRLRDHIESLIDAGVHGLVLCAGTGEFAFLSDDEKDRIISLGCEIVDGRIPVVAQTSAITTTDAIERTRRAADHGAAAVPITQRADQRGDQELSEGIASRQQTQGSSVWGELGEEKGQ